jgi:hypothetical protein
MNQTRLLLCSGLGAALLAAAALASCSETKPKSSSDSSGSTPAETTTLAAPYEGVLGPNSALKISKGAIVGAKPVGKVEVADADAAALAEFESGLHPKLVEYCGQCHAGQQAGPAFASAGTTLAFTLVKPYLNADPEASKIIINIRASHNAVDPAWADEVAPLVKAVADALSAP